MSQAEFAAWVAFYKEHPFDDLHRYQRPAAAVAAAMGANLQDVLAFLAPEPVPEGYSSADVATMKAFGVKPASKGVH
jgi:hypothetical protein